MYPLHFHRLSEKKSSVNQTEFLEVLRQDQTSPHIREVLEGLMHGKKGSQCKQKGLFDRASECYHLVQDSSEI